MQLTTEIQDAVENAAARAFASTGPHGVNVVPVSLARASDAEIWLFNFFMGKTVENISDTPDVALSVWTGLSGVQVKGSAVYETDGDRFEAARAWVAAVAPDRITNGVVVITPTAVFDVSADRAQAGKRLV